MKFTQILTLTFFFITAGSLALAGMGLQKADEIVTKTNHVALYQGDSMKAQLHLKITDKQGRVRQRALNILRKDSGNGQNLNLDQKYLAYFKAPADVRKMVFMVHKHTAPGLDDDRWLYMPAMDLVKRIAAGDKRTSFAGSDFLYEDISGRSIFEDTHELIDTTDTHYILRNRPKKPASVKFNYYLAHVRRDSFITDKMAFYKKGDILYRTMTVLEVRNIGAGKTSYPTVVKSLAKNIETGSTTEMTLSRVVYNMDLEDNIFSERYLRRPPREITR